jgi:hypothetical protein
MSCAIELASYHLDRLQRFVQRNLPLACLKPGPIAQLSSDMLAQILEFLHTDELMYSSTGQRLVSHAFHDAAKLCRVVSPLGPILKQDAMEYVDHQLWRRPNFWDVWGLAQEGMAGGDFVVPESLRVSLNTGVEAFLAQEPPTVFKRGTVSNIVNPFVSPYVLGVSSFTPSQDLPSLPGLASPDLFGRKSPARPEYQMIATNMHRVGGKFRFRGGINGLPRPGNEELYSDLERIFNTCKPHVEAAYGYALALAPTHPEPLTGMETLGNDQELIDKIRYGDWSPNFENKTDFTRDVCRGSLPDKIQIMVSIADIELGPGDSHEGGWHVDGFPHEHIVCTIDYTLECGEAFYGGELQFRRGFTVNEARATYEFEFEGAAPDEKLKPLGKVRKPQGRAIVFPNTHVHRVAIARSVPEEEGFPAKRRTLIMFVVNPKERVLSTEEVTNPHMGTEELVSRRDKMVLGRAVQDWNTGTPMTRPHHFHNGCFMD